jgi:iron(III) transport system ATP-binding protein
VEDGEAVIRFDFAPELCLRGLVRNASSTCKLEKGAPVTVSIRPEAIKETDDLDTTEQLNVVRGKVTISEFTGVSVNYLAQVGNAALKAMFVGLGHHVRQRGEEIAFHIPKESIYFLG